MADAVRRFLLRLSVEGAQQARSELDRLGEQGDRAFQRIVSGAQGASRALSLLGPVLSALSVGAIANFVDRAVDAVGGLGELADSVGVSTDALQAFRFAATEVGLRSEDLERGLAVLTRRIGEAAVDGGEAEKAFRKIGVAFLDASGNARATEGVLADIADRIAAIESPAERARIATEIFGDRIGQKLIPFLAQGRERLQELIAEALRYGVITDAELIVKADQASDKLNKLGEAFGRLATRIAAEAAPALSTFAAVLEGVLFGRPVSEQIRDLERERERISGLIDRAVDGVVTSTTRRGRTVRTPVEELIRAREEIDRQLEQLRARNQQYEEQAREILEGRTRTGANEAELRRQRAAEDIAKLRETFDNRLRIEREYQENLERIRRAAETGAIDPAQRQELETQALRARNEALEKLTRTTTTAVNAEERRLDALRRQLELAELVDERERFVAERVAGLTGAQRVEAERLANALFDLQQARREENQALSEAARLYEETRTPIERYIEALERLGQLRPVLELRFGAEQANEIISRQAQTLIEDLERAEKQTEQVDEVTRQLGFTFSSAFEDAIIRGRRFSEVLQGIAQDIARIIVRRSITEPLAGAFSSFIGGLFSSANGNVFDRSGVVPFARGGVVDRPTVFPFAGGIGLMGEAGPEAILPLARDPHGRLGVRASGAGGPVIIQSFSIDARGADPGSEARLRALIPQIVAAARDGTLDAIRRGGYAFRTARG